MKLRKGQSGDTREVVTRHAMFKARSRESSICKPTRYWNKCQDSFYYFSLHIWHQILPITTVSSCSSFQCLLHRLASADCYSFLVFAARKPHEVACCTLGRWCDSIEVLSSSNLLLSIVFIEPDLEYFAASYRRCRSWERSRLIGTKGLGLVLHGCQSLVESFCSCLKSRE